MAVDHSTAFFLLKSHIKKSVSTYMTNAYIYLHSIRQPSGCLCAAGNNVEALHATAI